MGAEAVVDGPVAGHPPLQRVVGGGALPGVDLRDVGRIGRELHGQSVGIGRIDGFAVAVIAFADGNVLGGEAPLDLVQGRLAEAIIYLT